MNDGKNKKQERGQDRRKTFVDPKDLPFPDRRQKDRRVYSEEEREELLKRIAEGEAKESTEKD